jgi:four helix bundle protein
MPFRERNYRNLKVWVAAHAAVLSVYRVTRTFPADERYGLVAQLRRAAISIAANVAEGTSRSSDAGFAQFVEVAYGSATETDYELLLAHDLDYLVDPEYRRLEAEVAEIRRMLASLRRTLRRNGNMAQPTAVPPSLPLTANR